ncbi:uncharacterized protein EI90DRAFT_3145889 [Cantharellus anzutake]|uniref:uncharacterized protein n=1 Tax=Cantharellus anzutake TaxID=1750568 RepID=UPI0019050C9A|nr:uncharacterized protein EI90DRAFT_3145889 [Cantharellus anzutake]KAF8329841.1 hypothetical protein EI90DRAFT_3145889 [Cantharellus anzutake]
MQQDRHAELIAYLDLAMKPGKGETGVVDFSVELFRLLGYVHRERLARRRADLPLLICGENRHAKTDVCVVDGTQNDILLLVQEDKMLALRKPVNARAQLVAAAIAAFNENNAQRGAIGFPPLAEKSIHFSGHACHCHGRHIPFILQNSCHPNSVNSYSLWNLS